MLSQRYQDQFSPELLKLQAIYEQMKQNLSELDEYDDDFEALNQYADEAYEEFRELYEETYGICLMV